MKPPKRKPAKWKWVWVHMWITNGKDYYSYLFTESKEPPHDISKGYWHSQRIRIPKEVEV